MKNLNNYSREHLAYLKKERKKKIFVIVARCLILAAILGVWELLAQFRIVDPFVTSSPSRVAKTIAEEQGNVIRLDHNQFVSTNRNAAVELKITLEAFGTEHKTRIMNELEKNGYRPRLIGVSL